MRNTRNKFSNFEALLDLNTAAALLGCSVSTITRYCEDGTLVYVTTHRGKRKLSRKIRPSTLHAFLAGNTVRPSPTGEGGNLPPLLLPPLAEIRPGVSERFNGNGMQEPPFVSQGKTVEDGQVSTVDTSVGKEGAVDVEEVEHVHPEHTKAQVY